MYTFKCLFPITSDDADRNYYVIMGDGSTMDIISDYIKTSVDVGTTSKIYKDFKFWLPPKVTSQMDIINKWVELDILKSISVYITEPRFIFKYK